MATLELPALKGPGAQVHVWHICLRALECIKNDRICNKNSLGGKTRKTSACSEGKAQHRWLLHRPINTQICVRIRLQSAYKVAAQLTQNQRRFVSNAEQHMENSLLWHCGGVFNYAKQTALLCRRYCKSCKSWQNTSHHTAPNKFSAWHANVLLTLKLMKTSVKWIVKAIAEMRNANKHNNP